MSHPRAKAASQPRMRLIVVYNIGLWLLGSAEIPLLIRQSNLFEGKDAEDGGAGITIDDSDSSGDKPSYYADFVLGCVTGGDITDLSESLLFGSAEECCDAM